MDVAATAGQKAMDVLHRRAMDDGPVGTPAEPLTVKGGAGHEQISRLQQVFEVLQRGLPRLGVWSPLECG